MSKLNAETLYSHSCISHLRFPFIYAQRLGFNDPIRQLILEYACLQRNNTYGKRHSLSLPQRAPQSGLVEPSVCVRVSIN